MFTASITGETNMLASNRQSRTFQLGVEAYVLMVWILNPRVQFRNAASDYALGGPEGFRLGEIVG